MGYVYDPKEHGWHKPPRRAGAPLRYCHPPGARRGQYRLGWGHSQYFGDNAMYYLRAWMDNPPSTLQKVDRLIEYAEEVMADALRYDNVKGIDPINYMETYDWAKMQRKLLRQLRRKLEP